MLRAAFCLDFKRDDTLLIWGDNDDMRQLLAGLTMLRRGESASFGIAGGPWLTEVKCTVGLNDQGSKLEGSPESVLWACSRAVLVVLVEAERLIEPLVTSRSGHQFIDDLESNFVETVMISVNEYPETLRRG